MRRFKRVPTFNVLDRKQKINISISVNPSFAAHSVNHKFPLLCLFVVSVVSHLGFEDGNGSDCASFWSLLSLYLS